MSSTMIELYQPEWNTTEHKGRIALKVDGAWNYVYTDDPAEYSLLIDLLRNGGPAHLLKDRSSWTIRTAGEEIGEGEA